MKLNITKTVAVAITLSALPNALFAQHGHLNAGAAGTTQDDPLIFANGDAFIADSGYVKTLTYAEAGRFVGFYQGGITPTALPGTADTGGPDPQAPAPGSFITAEMQLVEGPDAGEFALWESEATSPTYSVTSGEATSHRFALSESDGSPGSDPFGHIHGRRFTATKPGFYKLRFQLFDTSTNGAGGGPLHVPSDPLEINFQAGMNIRAIEPDTDSTRVRFAAQAGINVQVEASAELGPDADWQSVGGTIAGDDFMHEVEDDMPVTGDRFYRVREVVEP